jgi:hypothetical protein
MNAHRPIFLLLVIALLVGCSSKEPATPSPQPTPTPETKAPPAPPQPLTAPKAPESVQKKAEVGVGKKGRGYGQGFITTPAATLFTVKERIAYDIQIPQAMQMFKGTEGRAPNTHEEFMEKIIKANQINLPLLPDGERYIYDPKTEQLMVEQPAPQE